MSLALYGHPFSSYTQKVLIARYENGTPFEFRGIGPDTPQHAVNGALTGDDTMRREGLAFATDRD